jgi:hypothetical protein
MPSKKHRAPKDVLNWKGPRKPHPRLKDARRAEVPGRAAQGLGSAGRSGGTKSAGGHGGRSRDTMTRTARGGWKNGGGRAAR